MTLLPSVSTILEDELSIAAGTIGKKQTQHKVNTLYVNNLKYTPMHSHLNKLADDKYMYKKLGKGNLPKRSFLQAFTKVVYLAVLTENYQLKIII